MKEKIKVQKIIKILENDYPNASCSLNYETPLQLLIAARLSAQCTDKRVNIVTKDLFSKYKCAKDFSIAKKEDIEKIIRSCGLYKTKAENIIDICKTIVSKFENKVPKSMKDLTSLSGIGRKTANLVRAQIYGESAIIVDTHFSRITKRLGLHNLNEPLKIELYLKKIIPEEKATKFCHAIVLHGREICNARKPLCEKCNLKDLCYYYVQNSREESK